MMTGVILLLRGFPEVMPYWREKARLNEGQVDCSEVPLLLGLQGPLCGPESLMTPAIRIWNSVLKSPSVASS